MLDTPVSPELLPPKEGEIAQKTEDLVGPYELHDFFLYYTLRLGYGPEKIFRLACVTFEGAYDQKTIAKWLNYLLSPFLCTAVQTVVSAGWTKSWYGIGIAAR